MSSKARSGLRSRASRRDPAAALGFAVLVAAGPLGAAEGGVIRGGEHDGFTRIVLTIEPSTEWSLETAEGLATLHFPGKALAFDPAGVFEKIPRTRIRSVRAAPGATGTTVAVELACDCRVSTSFVGARYLALDIADREAAAVAPPAPIESPEVRAAREKSVVDDAEQALLQQIERAANQGVVTLSEQGPPRPEPAAAARPWRRPAPPPRHARNRRRRCRGPRRWQLLGNRRRTVSPRSMPSTRCTPQPSSTATAARRAPGLPRRRRRSACPTDRLAIGAWSNGLPFSTQLPVLRRALVGEFDQPSPTGLRDLARLYVRFGFGAEAEACLPASPAPRISQDRALLADLGRVVEGGLAAPDGPLAVPVACPGQHGLWQALGGVVPVYRDAKDFAGVQQAFEALPSDLRLLVGPGFAGRLLDAGRAPRRG